MSWKTKIFLSVFLIVYFILLTSLSQFGQESKPTVKLSKVGEWGDYRFMDVFIQGDYAYCITNHSLEVLNISVPSAPQKVSAYEPVEYIYNLDIQGIYAYVAEDHHTSDLGGFEIFNVENNNNPILVGSYYDSEYPQRVCVNGKYAYFAYRNHDYDKPKKVRVFDVSNPTNPKIARYYTTKGIIRNIQVIDKKVYITEGDYGKFIILEMKEIKQDDLIGSWPGLGIWYRDSDTGTFNQVHTEDADLLAAGDLDDDGIDDLIGIWAQSTGLWVKYSSSGNWVKIGPVGLQDLCVGDMNGDGRDDVVGNFSSGVWYRDSVSGNWARLYSQTAERITTGDIDNDGTSDLIGTWSSLPGIWMKSSFTGLWTKIGPSGVNDLAAGDMNGDGRCDVVGSFASGIWSYDPVAGIWSMLYTVQASQIVAGDLDGDGMDDLIGLWPSINGTWVRFSVDNSWEKLSSSAETITTGRMR